MVDSVSSEDLEKHPWLKNWDKKADSSKIVVLQEQIMYLENLIGTMSVILISLFVVVGILIFLLIFKGNISINPQDIVSSIKQFTFK